MAHSKIGHFGTSLHKDEVAGTTGTCEHSKASTLDSRGGRLSRYPKCGRTQKPAWALNLDYGAVGVQAAIVAQAAAEVKAEEEQAVADETRRRNVAKLFAVGESRRFLEGQVRH